jgi:hypothetical protein
VIEPMRDLAGVPQPFDEPAEQKKASYFELTVRQKFVFAQPWRDGNGSGENYQSHGAQSADKTVTREFCRNCAESKTVLQLLAPQG